MQTSEVAPTDIKFVVKNEPVQEPSDDETTDEVEDTTKNNESETSEFESDISEEEELDEDEDEVDEKANASKTIDRLGKEKKLLLEKLVSVAKQSPEAKNTLKELIDNNPNIAKKLKQSFGKDYDSMFKEPVAETNESDYEALKIKAKTEVLLEQAQELTAQQLDKFAQARSFNESERETFIKYYNAISEVEEADELEIMKRAAMLTNPEKIPVKRSLPSSAAKAPSTKKAISVNLLPKTAKKLSKWGVNADEKAENIADLLAKAENKEGRISLKL